MLHPNLETILISLYDIAVLNLKKKKNPDKIHILGSQSFKMLDIEIL